MATIINPTSIQSASEEGKKVLALAVKHNNWIFAVYIALLIAGIIFTCLLWKSGNNVQDAIRRDADARIEEAKKGVKELEASNLVLKGDLEAEKGKVAGLQRDAALAKTNQQRVEIELSKQQERTANAEKELVGVKKRQQPRNIDSVYAEGFKHFLEGKPKSPLVIACVLGNSEGCTFAEHIKRVFVTAGWEVSGVFPRMTPGNPSGISLGIGSAAPPGRMPTFPDPLPAAVPVLIDAFHQVMGIELNTNFPFASGLSPDAVQLFVGYQ